MVDTVVDRVRVDGLVVLKLIKHYTEEALAGQTYVTGILLGLLNGDELQVTHCFPHPRSRDDEDEDALSVYEVEMIRNLKELNVDYLRVGFYQGTSGGLTINRSNLEHIYSCQRFLPEAVLLAYDPTWVSRGQIGIKAYRLSPEFFSARVEAERRMRLNPTSKGADFQWECEAAGALGVNRFTRLFDEIPVVIHNSHLVNIALCDLVSDQESVRSVRSNTSSILDLAPALPRDNPGRFAALNLSMATSLEQQLRSLLVHLDVVHDYQHLYQRGLAKAQSSGIGKTMQETRNRELAPIRLDTALNSAQIDYYCTSLSQTAGQTMGKLMMTKALQPPPRRSNPRPV